MDGARNYLWRGKIPENNTTASPKSSAHCICEFYSKNAQPVAGVVVTVNNGHDDYQGQANNASMTTHTAVKENLVVMLKDILDGRREGGVSFGKRDDGFRVEVRDGEKRVGEIEMKCAKRGVLIDLLMSEWFEERKALKRAEGEVEASQVKVEQARKDLTDFVDSSRAHDEKALGNLKIMLRAKLKEKNIDDVR